MASMGLPQPGDGSGGGRHRALRGAQKAGNQKVNVGKVLEPPRCSLRCCWGLVPPCCSFSLEGALRDLPGAALSGQSSLVGSGVARELQVDRATQEPPRVGCSVAQVVQCAGYSQKLMEKGS